MKTNKPDPKATERTRARYQRISPIYDLMEALPERQFIPWRKRLWALVEGPRVLEVGIGTGKNIPFYPPDTRVTGIDLAPGMLEKAQERAENLNVDVERRVGDVQDLDFDDNSFDTAVATCVFCSVPDPVLGLEEIRRVVRSGGQIILLDHVRCSREPSAR